MTEEEIRALGLLAYKRGLLFEHKRDSLRKDIERLREFLLEIWKDRDLLQANAKAEHILCRKKLFRSEKELQETHDRLRAMEDEVACLLESKHIEMERLQKERDDALAKVKVLCAESCFLKGYGNHLEQKVCALLVKLTEYHQQLQSRTDEAVQTPARAMDKWAWVRQSMVRFQENLLEFQNTNTQLAVEKENYLKKLQELKQIEKINDDKLPGESTQAEQKSYHATQVIEGLQGKLEILENSLQSASARAEAFSSQLSDADGTILDLQDQVHKLHGKLAEMQARVLDYVKEKLEADAAMQLREAAISVLKLKIYALESDLQKEMFLRSHRLPETHLKSLNEFSPDVEVDLQTAEAKIEVAEDCAHAERCLGSGKDQQQDDADLLMVQSHSISQEDKCKFLPVLSDDLENDSWGAEKVRALDQTLAGAQQGNVFSRKGQQSDKHHEGSNIADYCGSKEAQDDSQSWITYTGCSVQEDWVGARKVKQFNTAMLHSSLGTNITTNTNTEEDSASDDSSEIVNQFLGSGVSLRMSPKFITSWDILPTKCHTNLKW